MTEQIGTIVLIDDEEIAHKQYTRILKRSGAVNKVISFTYADDALKYFKENSSEEFDVILLDINMPRMSGFEFLDAVEDEFKQKIAHVLIVMLTTSLNPQDREKAENNELVTDFINKPLDNGKIIQMLELLRKSKAS